jgi:hypothetical protein
VRPETRPPTRTVVFPVIGMLAGWLLMSTGSPTNAVPNKVPDPRNSTVDPVLVGSASGEAVDAGRGPGFRVVARDVNNSPLWGEAILLDFSSAPGIVLFADQASGTTVNCAARTLERITGTFEEAGEAIFLAGFCGHANGPDILVSADGVHLAFVPGRSLDLVGADGATNSADLNRFRAELFAPQPAAPETDFFVDGITNSADLNLFRKELLRGAVGVACP